jgi:hypothetical protein
MKRIADVNADDIEAISQEVRALSGFATAEEVAQAFVGIVYGHFPESLVLLRAFVTVPLMELPPPNQQFIARRGSETGTSHLINDRTPVLSLLGTRGRQGDWNDRRKSRRFSGIPLSSGEFVASLPMLSRLFKNMSFDLDLIDEWSTKVLSRDGLDEFSGALYVRDAGMDKDEQGRMIIPAQDFVAEHDVRTVFGFGNGYADHPALVTVFAFTGETLEESVVRLFAPLVEAFKSVSAEQVRRGHVFLEKSQGV